MCMKNYDYKDETKDVKGKVSSNSTHPDVDRTPERYPRIAANALRPKECSITHYPQPRRSDANDREEHLPPPSQCEEIQSWLFRDWN